MLAPVCDAAGGQNASSLVELKEQFGLFIQSVLLQVTHRSLTWAGVTAMKCMCDDSVQVESDLW